MSRIRANLITNRMANGAPTVSNGLVISGVTTVTTLDATNTPASIRVAQDIQHKGDADTKISFPANDTVAFETAGSERVRITSTGSVGIGTNNPDVGNTAYPVVQVHGTSTNAYFKLTNTTTGVGSGDGVELSLSGSDAYLTNRESASIIFRTGGSNERLRIDSSGRFLKGLTSAGGSRSSTSVRYPHFQLSSPWSSGLGSYKIECTDDYPIIFIDSNASYANGSGAGVITWSVKDSSGDYCNTASIRSQIDAAPSNDSAPGRLQFMTTTSGTTPTTKMTIDSAGRVTKPNTPFVMVHINSRTDWTTTGSQMVIPWDTIHTRSTSSNVGNHFNTSNHRFTAPVDGRYLFVLSLNIVGDNILYHRINGANVSGGEYRITDLVWDHLDASFIYDMNANDYYDNTSQLYDGSGKRWNGGGTSTYGWDTLSIYHLG